LITRKDLVVSILCTFCLTTVLLTMMPVQSAEWDPWLDVKEDGRINVLDLIKTASALGTMGDTTKNVTIAGRASKLITLANGELIPAISWFTSDPISVDGYSKISISIGFTEPEFDYYLWTGHDPSNTLFVADQGDETTLGRINCKTYDVMNTYIKIRVRNPGAYEGYLNLDVYLIP